MIALQQCPTTTSDIYLQVEQNR